MFFKVAQKQHTFLNTFSIITDLAYIEIKYPAQAFSNLGNVLIDLRLSKQGLVEDEAGII